MKLNYPKNRHLENYDNKTILSLKKNTSKYPGNQHVQKSTY